MKKKNSKVSKRIEMLNTIEASVGLRLLTEHFSGLKTMVSKRVWVSYSKTMAVATQMVTLEHEARVVYDASDRPKLRFYFSKMNRCEIEIEEDSIKSFGVKAVLCYLDGLYAYIPLKE